MAGMDSAVYEPSSRERALRGDRSILEDAKEALKYAGQTDDVRFDMGRGALKLVAEWIKPDTDPLWGGACYFPRLKEAIGVEKDDHITDEDIVQLANDCAYTLEVISEGETSSISEENLKVTTELVEKLENLVQRDISVEQEMSLRGDGTFFWN